MTTLKVQTRNIFGRKNKQIREKDFIPAVVYGHGFKSISLKVSYSAFEKVLKKAGESTLIDLEIGTDKPIKVLIYDMQYEPLTNKIQHIDFYKIKTGEKIDVDVELKFMGESLVVKEAGGVLVHILDKIKIRY